MSFVPRLLRAVALTVLAALAGGAVAFAVARIGAATCTAEGMVCLAWVVWGLLAGAVAALVIAVLVAPRLAMSRLAGFAVGIGLSVAAFVMAQDSGPATLVFAAVPLLAALISPDPPEAG